MSIIQETDLANEYIQILNSHSLSLLLLGFIIIVVSLIMMSKQKIGKEIIVGIISIGFSVMLIGVSLEIPTENTKLYNDKMIVFYSKKISHNRIKAREYLKIHKPQKPLVDKNI